ncbi:MAG: BMP family protein [Armatimonadota bacterium]|nr:BMP family protein [Armatimonadota bacterium]MDR7449839.1 BMP family protein [Armatimonadota bacterium]MDR7459119.1 BMP family protein [Armatimonadota bacterium]MDR7480393.1 BMP family protein [Armatimonadota bacterium]MDR7491160.1 BMP family protein [Armatimonadota bacterium]
MRHRAWVLLVLIATLPVALPAGVPVAGAPTRPRLAMILPGTIHDADFNAVGYQALKEVETTTGVQTAHSEQVAVADAERVAREYLAAGYRIVAFHGGQYLTIVQKLATQFPDAVFIAESAGQVPGLPPNVWNIGRKFYEGFYVLGVLAAQATATNKVGYIAGIRLPDFIGSLNAIFQAFQKYNPRAEVLYVFVGDQNDPVKARQAAESQIAAGADFIIVSVNLGTVGIIEAARAARRPVLLTTFYTDKRSFAPQHFTTSLLFNFAKPYVDITRQILRGKTGGYYEMRPGAGMSLLPPRNVPPEVARRVMQVFQAVVRREERIEEIADRIVEPRR